jgi:predicted alpha/beta-hydrolase family hydrolase
MIWHIPVGTEQTSAEYESATGPRTETVVVLGHGASTHREHPGMARLAATLLAQGLSVVRFNFLYTEKKKGPPDRMPRLMECFTAVVERTRSELSPDRLIIGGHSMGGRTASMMAAEQFPCDGLLLLGYPLHPAGQPEKLRDAHLTSILVATLCLNGTRDDLCQRDLMEKVLSTLPPTFTMHWLEAADHGFHVQKKSGRTEEEVLAEIGSTTRNWVERF